MTVALCQLDIAWEDKAANHERVEALLDEARLPPGTLLVLPEMFATGFSMNVAAIAEGDERPTEGFLACLASWRGLTVVGGVVTRDECGRGRNEAIAISPERAELARYHKLHPFSYGDETRHYAAGEQIALFRWDEFTVAPFVCYDLRFPEIFRHAVLRGAEVLVVIANWPARREEHWLTLLRARAIENQAYVVGVNRCGHDPKLAYSGRSQIIGPRGEIIADAGEREGIVTATLDRDALLVWRREFPALEDLRREFLGLAAT
jgi:omega-amidase